MPLPTQVVFFHKLPFHDYTSRPCSMALIFLFYFRFELVSFSFSSSAAAAAASYFPLKAFCFTLLCFAFCFFGSWLLSYLSSRVEFKKA